MPELHAALDALLLTLFEQGHDIYLLQTPAVPFRSGFSRAQRFLAAKYRARLLPKRLLTRTLGTRGATLDGLHLSDIGHRHLAQSLAARFRSSER